MQRYFGKVYDYAGETYLSKGYCQTQKENCIAYIFQTEIILKQPEFSKALKICNKERVQEKDLFAFSACLHT